MSVEHCFECDLDFDTDFFTECPYHDDSGEKWQCDYCHQMKSDVSPINTQIGDADICEECRHHPEQWGPA